ncbi:MAG: 5'/3'-nucleotidase SurE, partial [Acidimicrobiia bacterium]|nr:5'/3'-nucleotidase SurE [Acidimicrobiia bacterium]
MTWILVTNDDGVDAKALVPLARALGDLATVRVVAPDGERSWIGKAITRHQPLHVESIERGGLEMLSCSGTPADCVQLGIHTLFDEPPALVVSGINLGYNHGTGSLHTSGTVGAVLEA